MDAELTEPLSARYSLAWRLRPILLRKSHPGAPESSLHAPAVHRVTKSYGVGFSVVTRATTCTLVLFFRSFLVSYSFLFLSFSSLPCHFLTFSFFLSLSCERVRSTELFSLRIFLADTRKTVTLLVNRSTERRISTRTTRVTRVSFPPKSLRHSLSLSLSFVS